MSTLSFSAAREVVLSRIASAAVSTESVALEAAAGRVLATDIFADRDYPPFPRATRDGFALRAADLTSPGEDPPTHGDGPRTTLEIIGEVRAGTAFPGEVRGGQCVSIMTGAPVPAGADCVMMVEYSHVDGSRASFTRGLSAGDNIVPRGSESSAGSHVLAAGSRIDYPQVAMLASVGQSTVTVYKRPRVAIIPTGDEIVEVGDAPSACQIRNSNSYSLRAQVARAGGDPWPLPIAPDELPRLTAIIAEGLTPDLLLLSGGVSMGKFDLVEQVLLSLGAEIFFDSVEIQPGRPLVFGRVANTPFFGLPGNPLSTMVCFELFARPAIARLGGVADCAFLPTHAQLTRPVRTKPGLTRFLPAILTPAGVSLTGWQGSGDVAALTRANCFLIVPPDRPKLDVGEWVEVLPL